MRGKKARRQRRDAAAPYGPLPSLPFSRTHPLFWAQAQPLRSSGDGPVVDKKGRDEESRVHEDAVGCRATGHTLEKLVENRNREIKRERQRERERKTGRDITLLPMLNPLLRDCSSERVNGRLKS